MDGVIIHVSGLIYYDFNYIIDKYKNDNFYELIDINNIIKNISYDIDDITIYHDHIKSGNIKMMKQYEKKIDG
jgi:hypothetical protein